MSCECIDLDGDGYCVLCGILKHSEPDFQGPAIILSDNKQPVATEGCIINDFTRRPDTMSLDTGNGFGGVVNLKERRKVCNLQ